MFANIFSQKNVHSFSDSPNKEPIVKISKNKVAMYEQEFIEDMQRPGTRSPEEKRNIAQMMRDEGDEPDNFRADMIKEELLDHIRETGIISDEENAKWAIEKGYSLEEVQAADLAISMDAVKKDDKFAMMPEAGVGRLTGTLHSSAVNELEKNGTYVGFMNDMKVYEKGGKEYGITKGGKVIDLSYVGNFSDSPIDKVDTSLKAAKVAYEDIWEESGNYDTAEKHAVSFLEILADGNDEDVARWAGKELGDIIHDKKTQRDERNMEDMSFHTGDPDAGRSEADLNAEIYAEREEEEGRYYSAEPVKPKEYIPGGYAEGMDDSEFDAEQLEKGERVELEHVVKYTKTGKQKKIRDIDRGRAREISKDHLSEIPDYYDRLEAMEQQAEAEGALTVKVEEYN